MLSMARSICEMALGAVSNWREELSFAYRTLMASHADFENWSKFNTLVRSRAICREYSRWMSVETLGWALAAFRRRLVVTLWSNDCKMLDKLGILLEEVDDAGFPSVERRARLRGGAAISMLCDGAEIVLILNEERRNVVGNFGSSRFA